jgi:hypothetical protein
MADAVPPGGGYIHVLPVISQAGMSVTRVSFAPLPWSSSAYYGLLGNSSGEPTMVADSVDRHDEDLDQLIGSLQQELQRRQRTYQTR